MTVRVPSLTATGWLTELRERADALMAYYLTSEASQTHLYENKITSLPYHIRTYGSDEVKLRNRVETDLANYLQRYFEGLDVKVSTDIPDQNDPERLNLRLDITVMDQGSRYSLGKLIKVQNSKVLGIFDINNG